MPRSRYDRTQSFRDSAGVATGKRRKMKPHQHRSSTSPDKEPHAHAVSAAIDQGRWQTLMFGHDRRTRIRVQQWCIAAMTYLGSSMVLVLARYVGWLDPRHLTYFMAFVVVSQTIFYLALRSGLSAKLKDPALTVPQILVGLFATNWAYVITGPGRAIALMPLLLILVFGAFLLNWRKIAWLTGAALSAFAGAIVVLHWGSLTGSSSHADSGIRIDLLYLASLVVLLPIAAFIAAQLSRLRHTLRMQRGALAQALSEVQRLAEFDELTGLANRRRASNYLETQRALAQRGGLGFAVVLIDLDNFKRVNDTRGHEGGDQVLRAFASAAGPLMRGSDMIARWGGEEFLIILPQTGTQEAHAAATRLLERVRQFTPAEGGPLTFSAGVAQWRKGEPAALTIARADHRMYVAKHGGRNQVCMVG